MDKKQLDHHYRYCRNLESELNKISDYIELDEDNFKTFSLELRKLIILASSEFENVTKGICNLLDITKEYNFSNMKTISKKLVESFPTLYDADVSILDIDYTFKPLSEWKNENVPDWWEAYNGAKHNRYANFRSSNFENAIYAIAALKLVVFLSHFIFKTWLPASTWTLLQVNESQLRELTKS